MSLNVSFVGTVVPFCTPVYSAGIFVGTACILQAIAEEFEHVTYYSESQYSYAFLNNKGAKVLSHPLLHRPWDNKDKHVHIDISALERDSGAASVIESMKQ